MRQVRFHGLTWLWCCLLCSALLAAVPRADYQRRVNQAAQLIQSAAEHPETQTENTIEQLTKLLPAEEEVTEGQQVIRVNNAWLQEQFAHLPQLAPGEIEADDEEAAEDRSALWEELAEYLKALNARVNDLNTALPADFKLERNQLENILAREDYRVDERQASGTQQWLKRQWQSFLKWLRTLFRENEPRAPGKGTVNIARVIIIALLVAALAFAIFQGAQWWRQRQPKAKKEKSREILGVEIDEETTTEDLLAAARALAQQGDFRGAIRRAYIALLYELEQRGKLRLHRSKTNRDYLNALRHEMILYPSFAALTLRFEQVWYGQTQASQFDFDGFLNSYQQALLADNRQLTTDN